MYHKNNCSCTTRITVDFAQKCDKAAGRKSIKKWYAKVGEFDNKAFNDIAAAMYDREDEILNYFINRSTNASGESLNAKNSLSSTILILQKYVSGYYMPTFCKLTKT